MRGVVIVTFKSIISLSFASSSLLSGDSSLLAGCACSGWVASDSGGASAALLVE